MKWYLKAVAFKLLSAMPGGAAFYRFCQAHITKSLQPAAARVSQKIGVGIQYYNWLAEHQGAERLLQGVHLDFGAGWHPTIPLLYYSMGVERQYLFDVRPVLDGRLIQQTLGVFESIVGEPQWPHRGLLRRHPPRFETGAWRAYLGQLGMTYEAPYADVFPAISGAVDVVTSTQVLLHVPARAVPHCFSQIYGSLKPGGWFLATIHLREYLGGGFSTGLLKYRQLRYSPQTWERWINSPLMCFNRLRAPDYKELLENAGFEIRHFEVEPATPEELDELDRVQIAECFQRYTREDLAARHLFFVARKN